MGGGLMQLVAYGAQDIYLTGNPQITFFKVVYRRHTNFAMESIEQTFTGTNSFGGKNSCVISRNGDLVHDMYLEIDLKLNSQSSLGKAYHNKNERIGFNLIDYVEIEIGGQLIDKQYGMWMDIWSQLTYSKEQYAKLLNMITPELWGNSTKDRTQQKLYVPLQFWFNRNPGLALPLIALQYHEVKLNLKLFDNLPRRSNPILNNLKLYCNYIFLDTDERRRFAQVSHEYLIEQVQYNGKTTPNPQQVELRFNHPCKEVVWVVGGTTMALNNGYYGTPWVNGEQNKVTLQLNGHDRFSERDGAYFRSVQMYQHHTGGFLERNTVRKFNDSESIKVHQGGIYCYSFALQPEEHQPSGTCNFSRIDNAVLNIGSMYDGGSIGDRPLYVFATNYNVLRIMSGMGGLAYSN